MIFITLGTQDKPFNRLLEAVQTQIDKGVIKDRVVVQAGCTKFESKDMEIFDLIPMDDFDKLMCECDLLITHGGVGSIVTGLKKDKKVIAAARLAQYGEHVNDHQLQIIDNFDKAGYILKLDDFDKLDEVIERTKNFVPNKYTSNTSNMINIVSNQIDDTKSKSIGIFTIQSAKNYGGALQAYALRKKCLNYVDDVSIVNYVNKDVDKEYNLIKFNGNSLKEKVVNFIKSIIVLPYSVKKHNRFKKFEKEYFNLTKKYTDKDLDNRYPIFDKYIVGSDQVWNPDVTKGLRKAYTLEFFHENDKKVSYAASIAASKINKEDLDKLVANVKDFSALSVREVSGKELLSSHVNKEIEVVLDPTLLLTNEEWSKLAGERIIKDDYIFVYAFEQDDNLIKVVNDLAKKNSLKVISFDIRKKYVNSEGNYFGSGPVEFVNFIKYAKYVVTNSFHATVFSVIFEKEFFTIPFGNRGSRMIDLLNKLNIGDRIINKFEDYSRIKNKINYQKVNNILNEEMAKSIKYLESSISDTVYGNKENCCGCSACMNICPVGAIHMEVDNKGFKYPVIDEKVCIHCGMCKKVCPLKNNVTFNQNIEAYALKNKDEEIRGKSSSGGTFYLLANEIISNKGVVYGAAYDDNLVVKHIRIDKKNDIYKLMGSKYVQSDINDTFSLIKKDLDNNKKVLFSGSPCQVSGLLSFLKIKKVDCTNLITVDIICHSAPSPRVFDDYKKYNEEKYNSKLEKVNFRNKSNDKIANMELKFKNGSEYVFDNNKDIYYRLFFLELIKRDSCDKCKFKKFDRVSDITIGDYWGIERLDSKLDDKKGISLVLLNTKKGKELFKKIEKNAKVVKTEYEKCVQPALKENVSFQKKVDQFWNDYEHMSLSKIYHKYDDTLLIKIKKLIKKIIGR